MRVEPKTAGAIAAGAFFFLLIFGVGWPGPGAWLLIFALLFIAAAAVALRFDGFGIVHEAKVVLGQVAPTPWNSSEAARLLIGHTVDVHRAEQAGLAAVRMASPLSENKYKVQLAKVAVKRAILLAAGLETGGF